MDFIFCVFVLAFLIFFLFMCNCSTYNAFYDNFYFILFFFRPYAERIVDDFIRFFLANIQQ